MEQKDQKNEDEDLDGVLDDFDDKLNLTQDEKDIGKDLLDPQLEKEYQEMIKNMQNAANGEEPDMKQFQDLMSNILQGLGNDGGDPDKMKDILGDLGQGSPQNEQQFEQFANQLLYQFVEKDIIEEPLKEAKQSYINFLEKNSDRLKEDEAENYTNQLLCIDEILMILDQEPQNKDKLIKQFETMQGYGNPPDEIMSNSNNPLAFLQGIQNPGQQGQNPECCIF